MMDTARSGMGPARSEKMGLSGCVMISALVRYFSRYFNANSMKLG